MNPISATSNTKNGIPAGNAVLWAAWNSNATGKAPTYSQNYNRYSYAWNNPLKFFDPSGYINQYPDEGGIPTRHRDGGSGSATFAPGSMVNVWNGRGGFGPGSGRHWSDPYRSVWGNYMLGSRSSFIRIYGQNAHENYVSYYTGDNNRFVWNPVAGDEVYRESGKGYVNIYYSGGWVKASPFTGPAFGGGVPVYSNALMDGIGPSGQESESWFSKAWNSGIARFYFPDVVYINGSIVLTFLGGGAADIGLALPLRGKTAGTVYLYNTLKGKAGLHGGVSFNFGRSYYLGSIDLFDFEKTFGGNSSGVEGDYLFIGSSISVSELDRYDNLLLSIDFGFGPGIGGSVNIGAKTYNFPLFRIWY